MRADRAGRSGAGHFVEDGQQMRRTQVAAISSAYIFWPQSGRNFAVATCSIDATG